MKFNKSVSKQGRKQRRKLAAAGLHTLRKSLNAPLSRELRKSEKTRTAAVRKGCKVKILAGRFKGVTGTVTSCASETGVIRVDSAILKNQRGKESPAAIHANHVVIIELAAAPVKETKAAKKAAPKATKPEAKAEAKPAQVEEKKQASV